MIRLQEVNPRTVAAHAAVLGLLGTGAHNARGELNTSADTAMDAGERFSARIAGRTIGRFLMPKDPVRVEVTDWTALRDWCERNRPEEIHEVMVRQVSPTFVRWILELARRDEAGGVVVDHNGVVIDGVTVTVGAAAATLTLEEDAPATLARLLTDPATSREATRVVEAALSGVLGVPGVRLVLHGTDDPADPGEPAAGAGPGDGPPPPEPLDWDTPPPYRPAPPPPLPAGGVWDELDPPAPIQEPPW